ncbi:odorant receptor Or1-like [Leptopilina boulardi]|uniref:odorant receptor Or1-like n=1 Tax=Leptopilina boulardi TaxID=63433 RepID=UPI0021F67D86|nr:odorant receptor Or1-like [Leptopilina boulardi]
MKMDFHKAKVSSKPVKPFLLLKISLKVLRWMGTWAPRQKGISHYFFYAHTICIFVFMLGIFFFVEIIAIVMNLDNLEKIASSAPLFLTNIAHAYKFFTINRNRRKIQDLLSIIESPTFSNYNSRYERIIMWYTWQNIFHNGIYQILGIMTVLFWAAIPVTALLDGNELQLPLDGWYPFNTKKLIPFMLTWSHQTVAIIMCCINNLAIDALISSLLNVASCQFEILKWNIAKIGDIEEQNFLVSSNKKEDKLCHNKNINEELRYCIKHNLAIFNFIKEVEKIFSSAIGLQLFVNCFVTCLSTFYITQLTIFIPGEIIGTSAYIFCMTYQSFIYCINGNELFLQNDNLSMAVYMGNWWKLKPRYKRILQIVMLRTRRPLILMTPFLLKLSLSTFVSVIQTSYSIFTLLYRKHV